MMKMNKRITSCLLTMLMCLSLFSFAACQSGEDAAPKGMKLASNDIVDYVFYVPTEWTIDLSTGAIGAFYSNSDPSSVSTMAWNLMDNTMTLDRWWEDNVSDLELVFDDFNLEKTENMILDGVAAKQFVYTASLLENHYQIMQVACIHRGMVYLITYTSVAENYESHLEEVTSMLENFKFR